jgi:DNA-binding transcriptional ArsR family regulator
VLTLNLPSFKLNYMVKLYTEPLDATFFALSDPTRRAVLARLSMGDVAVTELAKPFAISLVAVTKHLDLLENAGLIVREKAGRTVTCRLNAAPLSDAANWMSTYERFWCGQFDALVAYLAQEPTAKEIS